MKGSPHIALRVSDFSSMGLNQRVCEQSEVAFSEFILKLGAALNLWEGPVAAMWTDDGGPGKNLSANGDMVIAREN